MKKIIYFMLCMCMCTVLFACGGNSIEDFDDNSQKEAKSVESQGTLDSEETGDLEKTTSSERTGESSNEAADASDKAGGKSGAEICIYICGCVKKPGVYNLPDGSRVCDAIEAAGGYTKDADLKYWNQAQQMSDGMMIYVPSVEEKLEVPEQSGEASTKEGKININTGTKEELISIPGIGESRAESIIKYREENGDFTSIEDILLVSGIGTSLFEKMREYITVK